MTTPNRDGTDRLARPQRLLQPAGDLSADLGSTGPDDLDDLAADLAIVSAVLRESDPRRLPAAAAAGWQHGWRVGVRNTHSAACAAAAANPGQRPADAVAAGRSPAITDPGIPATVRQRAVAAAQTTGGQIAAAATVAFRHGYAAAADQVRRSAPADIARRQRALAFPPSGARPDRRPDNRTAEAQPPRTPTRHRRRRAESTGAWR